MAVAWHEVALVKSLADVNVIQEHIVLGSKSQHYTQAASVRNRTETIFKIN